MRDRSKIESEFDALLALELQYGQQEPYASIGRYTHVMCRATET
jgi:S-adenosylmethionine-dependent methyltransferase